MYKSRRLSITKVDPCHYIENLNLQKQQRLLRWQ